jgi:UDP-N-acetylmuramyl pentapeptide phosphotransferase/UDP-N-acetylglucosamine-1-phosphate transferase
MDKILTSAILSFIITYFAIPVIIKIARKKKLYDEPDERKVHKVVIPTLGGLGIFAGFIIAILLCTPIENRESIVLKYFAASALILFFMGLKDDILTLTATKKLIVQILAAVIIIHFGDVYIHNMHGFLGIHEIPQTASFALTLFAIIVITNSFNLIDGIDGLAGSLGLLSALVFGVYFFEMGFVAYAVMAFSLAGSLMAFLIFNFSPAKIFMGDTGSLLIGFTNSILVIQFINLAVAPTARIHLEASPAIGFAILIVPLFDTLRVFGIRILSRRSPFSPDKTHVHHFLLNLGLNHKEVVFSCIGANLVFIISAYLLRSLGNTILIGIILSSAGIIMAIISYLSKSRVKKSYKVNSHGAIIPVTSTIYRMGATKTLEAES